MTECKPLIEHYTALGPLTKSDAYKSLSEGGLSDMKAMGDPCAVDDYGRPTGRTCDQILPVISREMLNDSYIPAFNRSELVTQEGRVCPDNEYQLFQKDAEIYRKKTGTGQAEQLINPDSTK